MNIISIILWSGVIGAVTVLAIAICLELKKEPDPRRNEEHN